MSNTRKMTQRKDEIITRWVNALKRRKFKCIRKKHTGEDRSRGRGANDYFFQFAGTLEAHVHALPNGQTTWNKFKIYENDMELVEAPYTDLTGKTRSLLNKAIKQVETDISAGELLLRQTGLLTKYKTDEIRVERKPNFKLLTRPQQEQVLMYLRSPQNEQKPLSPAKIQARKEAREEAQRLREDEEQSQQEEAQRVRDQAQTDKEQAGKKLLSGVGINVKFQIDRNIFYSTKAKKNPMVFKQTKLISAYINSKENKGHKQRNPGKKKNPPVRKSKKKSPQNEPEEEESEQVDIDEQQRIDAEQRAGIVQRVNGQEILQNKGISLEHKLQLSILDSVELQGLSPEDRQAVISYVTSATNQNKPEAEARFVDFENYYNYDVNLFDDYNPVYHEQDVFGGIGGYNEIGTYLEAPHDYINTVYLSIFIFGLACFIGICCVIICAIFGAVAHASLYVKIKSKAQRNNIGDIENI